MVIDNYFVMLMAEGLHVFTVRTVAADSSLGGDLIGWMPGD